MVPPTSILSPTSAFSKEPSSISKQPLQAKIAPSPATSSPSAVSSHSPPLGPAQKKDPLQSVINPGQQLTVCSNCRQLLRSPTGSEIIRCPKCNNVNIIMKTQMRTIPSQPPTPTGAVPALPPRQPQELPKKPGSFVPFGPGSTVVSPTSPTSGTFNSSKTRTPLTSTSPSPLYTFPQPFPNTGTSRISAFASFTQHQQALSSPTSLPGSSPSAFTVTPTYQQAPSKDGSSDVELLSSEHVPPVSFSPKSKLFSSDEKNQSDTTKEHTSDKMVVNIEESEDEQEENGNTDQFFSEEMKE